ncbi:VOC family protein [Streptomyces chromofuscus]|uniref:VOC family protein n=1 Tax=Streptomyces chromofuscus TaxID=42881 RepID=A0A7M2T2B5_STRCW|nr:VOC family protein [Streptomyces chromofuscus]QOV41661.1 VOC family protein [Streptomyces chromofuscus]GGT39024.1 glyoxalase [Streptomyces chromofuscus]
MSPARLSTVVLDAHDAHELAGFYVRLLGYAVRREEPHWVLIGPPPGTEGTALAFETEPAYVRPVWPTRHPGDQQMMLHLDVEVDDLAGETARALAEGATLAEYQPQSDVRVLLDPSGHPFCLWTDSPQPPLQ